MTKTLTEQWKDGKLPAGEYYVKDSNGVEKDGYYPENSWERGFVNHSKHEVKEVLEPVPSYDEYKRLQEQLNEAQHTIYCIANTDGSDCKTILETIIRDANLYLEKWGVK